jgi:hypothetical protein
VLDVDHAKKWPLFGEVPDTNLHGLYSAISTNRMPSCHAVLRLRFGSIMSSTKKRRPMAIAISENVGFPESERTQKDDLEESPEASVT